MTHDVLPPNDAAPQRRRPSVRALQIALAVSVALNLLVAGMAAGAMLNRDKWAEHRAISRDMGFGPLGLAMRPEDRRALRQYLQEKAPQLRAANAQRRAELVALQQALRAEPFDPQALRAALENMQQRLSGQLALGQEAVTAVILAIPEADRRAMADRLGRAGMRSEKSNHRGGHKAGH
jgi:uncharacterized membrane protein